MYSDQQVTFLNGQRVPLLSKRSQKMLLGLRRAASTTMPLFARLPRGAVLRHTRTTPPLSVGFSFSTSAAALPSLTRRRRTRQRSRRDPEGCSSTLVMDKADGSSNMVWRQSTQRWHQLASWPRRALAAATDAGDAAPTCTRACTEQLKIVLFVGGIFLSYEAFRPLSWAMGSGAATLATGLLG